MFLMECERKHYKAKERFLRALMQKKTLDYTLVTVQMKISTTVIKEFLEKGIIRIEYERCYRNSIPREIKRAEPLRLSEEQNAVADDIFREWERPKPRPCLIKGVTGSGKTEVYMKLISHVLKEGKQVIVLIPEIALTYQNVSRFYSRFGNCVSLINSRLSQGERFDQFERAKKGKFLL